MIRSIKSYRSVVGIRGLVSAIKGKVTKTPTLLRKIRNGTKPAELPVEYRKKFEYIVNMKAAKQFGLTIPPNVLVRTNRVIK